jgi:hypothetical protein
MKYALLILVFCGSAMASSRSDETCKVTVKDGETILRGTVGVQRIGNTPKFRLMYFDSDNSTFYYDEGTSVEYTGKDVEDLAPEFCIPFLGEEVCSRVKRVTSYDPDHEDAPAIIHYFDESGNLLGRVGGFPGLVSACE